MIEIHHMYSMVCDNCSQDLFLETEVYSTIQEVERIGNLEGWHREGTKHYCPSCHQFDEDDNLIITKLNDF